VEFVWQQDAVYLSQRTYTKDLLEKYRMDTCNIRSTPSEKKKLTKPTKEATKEEREWLETRGKTTKAFRQLVGSLRYLADKTRPDISYSVGQLARHMQDPRREHWLAAKHVLAYLRGTIKFSLRFMRSGKNANQLRIVGWSDSDWAQDPDNFSSTSGYVFTYAGGAISWRSKKQPMIARSSAEAELIALDLASREGLWLRKLERALKLDNGPTPIREDNEAAIAISEKNHRTQRTKHISVKFFAICEDVERGSFKIEPVASADNTSDTFTKGLERTKFIQFRAAMGIVELPTEGER
jgi:hypothetical protein